MKEFTLINQDGTAFGTVLVGTELEADHWAKQHGYEDWWEVTHQPTSDVWDQHFLFPTEKRARSMWGDALKRVP